MKKVLKFSLLLVALGLVSCASPTQDAFKSACLRADDATVNRMYATYKKDFKLKNATTKKAMCENMATLPSQVLSYAYMMIADNKP